MTYKNSFIVTSTRCFMDAHIWEDWHSFPDLDKYLISKYGEVYSLFNGKMKKPRIIAGYYCFSLNDTTFRRSRLVAIINHPNPENKPQVNHKDGNKLNDHPDNLEWCTCSENQIHAIINGLIKKGADVKKAKVVIRMILKGKSNSYICNKTGSSSSNVSSIRRGRYYGYISGIKNTTNVQKRNNHR